MARESILVVDDEPGVRSMLEAILKDEGYGVASVGTAMTPRLDTWLNASAGCSVLAQEPMHNFGMQHSSSLACPGASLLDNPAMCTVSEYGDFTGIHQSKVCAFSTTVSSSETAPLAGL